LAGVQAIEHILLSDFKVRKLKHTDFNPDQSGRIFRERVQPAALALAAPGDRLRDS